MSDRTLADLAREALAVQDACNLSGVAQGFARAMIDLCRLVPSGTDERNNHPIAALWIDKMASLAGIQSASGMDWSNIYGQVERLTFDEKKPSG